MRAFVLLRTESERMCQIVNSRHCAFGYDQRVEVFGDNGRAAEDGLPEDSSAFFVERYKEAYKRGLHVFLSDVVLGKKSPRSALATRSWLPSWPNRPSAVRRKGAKFVFLLLSSKLKGHPSLRFLSPPSQQSLFLHVPAKQTCQDGYGTAHVDLEAAALFPCPWQCSQLIAFKPSYVTASWQLLSYPVCTASPASLQTTTKK